MRAHPAIDIADAYRDNALSTMTPGARITAAELTYEEPEADEEALGEVAEFVRVAVMLVHSDCVLGPRHRRKLN